MTKPVLGIVVGGVLGILDGLTAPLSAPETLPQLPMIPSSVRPSRGLSPGILIGLFARKVRSVPAGLVFGLLVGGALAALITIGGPYFWKSWFPDRLSASWLASPRSVSARRRARRGRWRAEPWTRRPGCSSGTSSNVPARRWSS